MRNGRVAAVDQDGPVHVSDEAAVLPDMPELQKLQLRARNAEDFIDRINERYVVR